MFKILAIDPALSNVGWIILEFDCFKELFPEKPSWIDHEVEGGCSTYGSFSRIDGGVVCTDKSEGYNQRLINQVDEIHLLVSLHKPDLLVFESQLAFGSQRCTWGMALQLGLIFPYYKIQERAVRTFRCPTMDYLQSNSSQVFSELEYVPSMVVGVNPAQLQSMAHHEKKTKRTVVVRRFHEVSHYYTKITDHEADAYFLGIHAGRFWASCVNQYWDQGLLTKREYRVFLDSKTGLLFNEGDSWWRNGS
jgi:Holliday junction resolvasome RuvABC endonuclease subunit